MKEHKMETAASRNVFTHLLFTRVLVTLKWRTLFIFCEWATDRFLTANEQIVSSIIVRANYVSIWWRCRLCTRPTYLVVGFVLDQHTWLDLYSASSLKKQFAHG